MKPMQILLENLEFGPVEGPFVSGLPFLQARLSNDNGQITISEHSTGQWAATAFSTDPASAGPEASVASKAEAPVSVWAGPVAEARFVFERTKLRDTLKYSDGTVLWSKASDLASPDLLVESAESGKARLVGKRGALLWEGILPGPIRPGLHQGWRHHSHPAGDSYFIDKCGVHITGIKGVFTVTDEEGRVLWSGTLPPDPVLLVRCEDHFAYQGRYGTAATGREWDRFRDEKAELHFAVETGEVVLEVFFERTRLGARMIDLLRCTHSRLSTRSVGPRQVFDPPGSRCYITPKPNPDSRSLSEMDRIMNKMANRLRFLYRDAGGNTVHQLSYLAAVHGRDSGHSYF